MEEIKDAVVHLRDAERKQFAEWFEELEEGAWERRMTEDLAPGGRGAHLLEKIDREIDRGNFTSLDEGFRLRGRQQRSQ